MQSVANLFFLLPQKTQRHSFDSFKFKTIFHIKLHFSVRLCNLWQIYFFCCHRKHRCTVWFLNIQNILTYQIAFLRASVQSVANLFFLLPQKTQRHSFDSFKFKTIFHIKLHFSVLLCNLWQIYF